MNDSLRRETWDKGCTDNMYVTIKYPNHPIKLWGITYISNVMIIVGKLNKQDLLKQLNLFYSSREVKTLAKDHGLDEYLFHQVRNNSIAYY